MLINKIDLIPRYNWDYGFADLIRAVVGSFKKEDDASKALKDVFGSEPVLANAGRTSLYVVLKSLNLPEGSEVGIPLFCCPVVFEAVRQAGLTPRFVDISLDSYGICARDLAGKAGSLKAVLVVHMFGQPVDLDPILSICDGLPVIEDCAQSLFSMYKGRYTGFLSSCSFFSFRSGKYISAGEGSAIFSKDRSLLERARETVQSMKRGAVLSELIHCAAVYAKSTFYKRPLYGTIGYPLGRRIDRRLNLSAKSGFKPQQIRRSDSAIVGQRIRVFLRRISTQRENAFYLLESIKNGSVALPGERKETWSNFSQFAVRLANMKERDRMADWLFQNGIDSARYGDEVLDVARRDYGYAGDCPCAELASKTVLVIPNHYTLSKNDLDRIAEAINTCSKLPAEADK